MNTPSTTASQKKISRRYLIIFYYTLSGSVSLLCNESNSLRGKIAFNVAADKLDSPAMNVIANFCRCLPNSVCATVITSVLNQSSSSISRLFIVTILI